MADEQHSYTEHSFTLCEKCNGRGFFRKGGFGYTQFPRCVDCKGIGQVYLDPKGDTKPG